LTDFKFDNRIFVGVENYDDGDLTGDTLFHYHQKGSMVWGTCEGGGVLFGTLVAKVLDDGRLDMVWQYLNTEGKFVSGTCVSTPEILPDGRYRLHETWEILSGGSGTSIIEEIHSPLT